MTTKVAIFRKWTEAIPIGRDGNPIPKNLWPRRRKHVWVVRWFAQGTTGKMARPSKSFARREDAEAFRSEKVIEFERNLRGRRIIKKITVSEFNDEMKELKVGPTGRRLKSSTLKLTQQALSSFGDFVGEKKLLQDVDPRDAAAFFSSLHDRGNLCNSTINKYKEKLKAAFNTAIKQLNLIRNNPFAGISRDGVGQHANRYVSPEEFSALVDACRTGHANKRIWWKAFLTVCYTAGLRLNEAVNLCWQDVEFESNLILVTSKASTQVTLKWEPKDKELRRIPVPDETMKIFAELRTTSQKGHPYVFLSNDRVSHIKAAQQTGLWDDSKRILNNFPREFRCLVTAAAKRVNTLLTPEGKPSISVHDLRRTCITNWSRVANIKTVMSLAGHSNERTTLTYYMSVTEDQIELARTASAKALSVVKIKQTDPKVTPKVANRTSPKQEVLK